MTEGSSFNRKDMIKIKTLETLQKKDKMKE